jgi:phospholipid/cholesterol/gamma-HCH transport system ATP-binding protein
MTDLATTSSPASTHATLPVPGVAAQGETAIAITGVKKRFGRKIIFDGLDLLIHRGETLTVLGPSGCGKSVLLRLITGLIKCDSGSILVDDLDIVTLDERALRPVRKKLAILFQDAALFDSMNVGENVAYGLRERDESSVADIRTRVAECLEWVGLPGTEAMATSDLSGGMKKRIGLARALAPGPEMILYDEPTTGLDPSNSRRISELILSLQDRLAVTSLVITHDIQGAFLVSNRIALLREHRIALVVDAAEAQKSPGPALEQFLKGNDIGGTP